MNDDEAKAMLRQIRQTCGLVRRGRASGIAPMRALLFNYILTVAEGALAEPPRLPPDLRDFQALLAYPS